MKLAYDPELGDILDEQGRQVASLQPGPDRDRLGRLLARSDDLASCVWEMLKWGGPRRYQDSAWGEFEDDARRTLREAGVEP